MNKGKIIRIVGPVVDVEFTADSLPAIYNSVVVRTEDQDDKNLNVNLTMEVEQHLGNNTVRCVAMSSTDGLVRGMVAVDTGAAISVPVLTFYFLVSNMHQAVTGFWKNAVN